MGLSVHQVAISSSDVPSYVKFPTANGKSGIEKYGIHSLATNKKEVDFYEVKLTSVDKFVRDEGIVNVDILKIDTEGNDSLVLLGSIHTISTLRPSYITFENHGIGHWKKASLEETIDLLNGLAYTCFWSTYDGHLIRITSCWDSSYEYKEWSNVACYNKSDKEFAEIMESYAL
jgi:FkbM family methyltransferase